MKTRAAWLLLLLFGLGACRELIGIDEAALDPALAGGAGGQGEAGSEGGGEGGTEH